MRTLVLTFVLIAFAEAIDPAKFQCHKNSPTGGDVFSDGDPPINLAHIFCGQINRYGQAIGFHSRPNGIDPPSAKTGSYWYEYQEEFPLSYDDHANFHTMYWSGRRYLLYYYTISLWNGCQWVPKEHDTTFWPTYIKIPHVVVTIETLYNTFASEQEGKICIGNYFDPSNWREKFDVVIIVQYGAVTTAYPGDCSKLANVQIYKYDHNYYQRRHGEL